MESKEYVNPFIDVGKLKLLRNVPAKSMTRRGSFAKKDCRPPRAPSMQAPVIQSGTPRRAGGLMRVGPPQRRSIQWLGVAGRALRAFFAI